MGYPFTVPGYGQVPFVLRTGVFAGTKILYQGVPLEKTSVRTFRQTFPDGFPLVLEIKAGGLSFTPQVIHGTEVIKPVPPLPGYAMIFIYLPLALIALGGAIGGAVGGLGAGVNVAIFRSGQPPAIKIVLSLLIAFGAVLLWLVIAIPLTAMIHH